MDAGGRLIAWTWASALLSMVAIEAAAQTMFKCKDGRGQITYSNIPCEKQGLRDAGAVAERTTTLRMVPPKPASPAATPAAAPAATPGAAPKPDSEIGPMPAPAQIKPVNPLIEKILGK